jgi:archaemetzincin
MKPSKPLIFIFALLNIIFCFCSCQYSKTDKPKQDNFTIIDIQPFKDISKEEQNYVANALKKVYPNIKLLEQIDLPKSAFNPNRNRYRADSIIQYLNKLTPNGHITIGLTSKDISTTKNEISDWGVMGLGFRPGNACVASSFRLAKNEKLSQLFKISIHELGHTEGLPHCAKKYCFMRNAEGRNPTSEEKEFCQTCKSFLTEKGWNLN